MQLGAKFFKCLVVELSAIINDNDVEKFESIDVWFLEEDLDCSLGDVH